MTETILVLDDEPGITLLCNRLLKRAGFDVVAYTRSAEAFDYLRSNLINLLLVDIRMPDIDGFEAISRAKGLQPDIAVLVMTGFGTVETAIQALRQGVDGLVLKPFEQGNELVEAVKQALIDSQKKRDAARIQALRPLFNVTDALLSETHPDRLLDLINTAIRGHLRCSHFAYYQVDPDDDSIKLLSGQGNLFDPGAGKGVAKFVGEFEAGDAPTLVNVKGPGEPDLQERLKKKGLGAAIFIPVKRPGMKSLLFAGRDPEEPPFSEADLEMFLILANQSAVAIENARLYADLREYVKQVEESQQALLQAEKMAAAGRLTASIAHEVNNPLQSMQNCLHLAGRQDLPPEERAEYFELAKTELNRLMSTVQRMLDFYRPGAVAPQKIKIIELLQHVLNLMSQQLDNHSVKVELDVPAGLPNVMAVSGQIQQVFINLILNAFDAMPNGGKLHIRARAVRGGVELFFQDSGPGIPDDRLAHIFEPFFSTKESGTGLGLTVSYNILTAHGGLLEFVQDSGPGACFRVYLPAGGRQ